MRMFPPAPTFHTGAAFRPEASLYDAAIWRVTINAHAPERESLELMSDDRFGSADIHDQKDGRSRRSADQQAPDAELLLCADFVL